jgi:hypothetical protein
MKSFDFDQEIHYKDDEDGIPLRVVLTYANVELEVTAKVDTGAAVCLFSYDIGRALGVPIEQGRALRLGGLTGALESFGHEVTLQTGDLVFQSVVYFARHPGLPRNLLGRRGWLRNLRLAVIDYDSLLYLSAYDS